MLYNYMIIKTKTPLMDTFSSLSQRAKLLIISSTLFIISLSLGFLVFGSNALTHENDLLKAAQHSAKADMLFVDPSAGHGAGH